MKVKLTNIYKIKKEVKHDFEIEVESIKEEFEEYTSNIYITCLEDIEFNLVDFFKWESIFDEDCYNKDDIEYCNGEEDIQINNISEIVNYFSYLINPTKDINCCELHKGCNYCPDCGTKLNV